MFVQPRIVSGWSETYYNGAATHQDALVEARVLLDLRLPIMGSTTWCQGIRVCDVNSQRDSLWDYFDGVPKPGIFGKAETADFGWTAILTNLIGTPSKKNRKFLRGIPDSIATVVAQGDRPVLKNQPKDVFRQAWNGFTAGLMDGDSNWLIRNFNSGTAAYVYQSISQVQVVRVTERRIGRPFGHAVGRKWSNRAVNP